MGGRGSAGRTRVGTNAASSSWGQASSEARESRIRDAYQELATRPQDWIRLCRLRDKLGNPDKAEMDNILLSMIRTGRVHLVPSSNRKALTDADHAAAIRLGGQDKHLIAIESDEN